MAAGCNVRWTDVAAALEPGLLLFYGILIVSKAARGRIPPTANLWNKFVWWGSGAVLLGLALLSLLNEGGVADGKIRLTILTKGQGIVHPEMSLCGLGVGMLFGFLVGGVLTYTQSQRRK